MYVCGWVCEILAFFIRSMYSLIYNQSLSDSSVEKDPPKGIVGWTIQKAKEMIQKLKVCFGFLNELK